jgi:predicted protein tyrosine phosphatase
MDVNAILPNLFIGNYQGCEYARAHGMLTLCVADPGSHGLEPNHGKVCSLVPVTTNAGPDMLPPDATNVTNTASLDLIASWISTHWHEHQLYIHCMAGAERSPLTVVWFLCKTFELSVEDAYTWVKLHRAETQDRRSWLTDQPTKPKVLI